MADPEKAQVDGNEVEVDDALDDDKADNFTNQLMKNPQVLAALQSKLGNMVGVPSGYIQSLPKVVKRRIKALKKLQLECCNIEAQFFQEVHSLECKYANMYAPLLSKRTTIVNGSVEPTDEECDFPSDTEDEDELASPLQEDVKDKVAIEDKKENENTESSEDNPSGIPEFWLTIFKNVEMIAEMIQEHDEPILKHLYDVKVIFSEKDPMGFKLEFYFSDNEYFTNTVLTKEYEMKCSPDEDDPFSFEGPEIYKCKGSTINWNKGKNVTVKNIKKKQKHKSKDCVRTVTKTVQNDSFFNFFNPPEVPDDEDCTIDEEIQTLLSADFEIGHFIRERIVPRAVLYFTGEALQDDEDYEEEDDDEMEEDEDDDDKDDDENDPDFQSKGNDQPPQCKQQ